MSFTEDFADFLHADTPGYQVAAVVFGGTATVSVGGLFDDAWGDALSLVTGTRPSLLVTDASIPGLAQGDLVTVAGTVYAVAELQPDGTGLTRLVLSEA